MPPTDDEAANDDTDCASSRTNAQDESLDDTQDKNKPKPESPSSIEWIRDVIANPPPPLFDARVRLLGFDVLNTSKDKGAERKTRRLGNKVVSEFVETWKPRLPRPTRNVGRGWAEMQATKGR